MSRAFLAKDAVVFLSNDLGHQSGWPSFERYPIKEDTINDQVDDSVADDGR